MTAAFLSRQSSLDAQLAVLERQLSSTSAKTDAMYEVHRAKQLLLQEQKELLRSVVAPYYSAVQSVLSARLQAVLLLATGERCSHEFESTRERGLRKMPTRLILTLPTTASPLPGLLQPTKSRVLSGGDVAATALENGCDMLASALELAGDCLPVVGKVVAALVRKGADLVDKRQTERKEQRLGDARLLGPEDASRLGELAARRSAQFFRRLLERDEAELARFSPASLKEAGRTAGQLMFDTLVGGGFDQFLRRTLDNSGPA